MVEFIIRGPCGQDGCRERYYYLDNGLWFCRARGHQQEGRQVEEDPEDFGTQGKAHRVKKAVAEKAQKTYRGRQAYALFLQAYQLILWRQSHALVHERGYPAEFENVIRDLWALRLESFSDKISDDADDSEPELFSSQPGAMEPDEVFKLSGKHIEWPRLIDSIALCYLGSLLMRLPVTVGDIYRMVMREEVPFIRVIKTVPREIRDKLPQEYLSILETKTLLEPEHIHKAAMELALLYNHKFGVIFPPLNSPLLLFRWIKRLALPIEVYPAFQRLQELSGFDLSYPTNIAGKRRPLHLPELQMMTLLVISAKILFPFDNSRIFPHSLREPASQAMNWKLWGQVQRHFDRSKRPGDRIGKGNEIRVTEKDVFKMTPSQLDEYLDWYENSWLDNSRVTNPLADLFPISRGGEGQPITSQENPDEDEAINSMLHTVTAQLKPRKTAPETEENIPRPGTAYSRYRTESELPEAARSFYETAAKVVGVPLHTLVGAVFQAEIKMARWQEEQRRIEYHDEEMELDVAENVNTDMDEMDMSELEDGF